MIEEKLIRLRGMAMGSTPWPSVMLSILRRSSSLAPVLTGRLSNSGSAFWAGKLVGVSGGGTPMMHPPTSVGGAVVFSTPKRAGPAATKFYMEGGEKWFDYAQMAHQHSSRPNYLFWVPPEWVIGEVMRRIK